MRLATIETSTRKKRIVYACGVLLALPCMAWGGQPALPQTESVIVFNTACARCHEGQCSGRLSFSGAAQDTFDHIARHYRPAAERPGLQQELHTILGYMKSECAFYPLDIGTPPDRQWDADSLARLSTPAGMDYFIPLGNLHPGTYRLSLTTDDDGRLTLQVLDEGFDWLVDTCRETGDRRLEIGFDVAVDTRYYLRVLSRGAGRLTGLALQAVAEH